MTGHCVDEALGGGGFWCDSRWSQFQSSTLLPTIVVHTCICMHILVEKRDISPRQVFLPTRPCLPTRQVFCLLINFSPFGELPEQSELPKSGAQWI